MIASVSRKVVVGIAIVIALLWTLGLGLVYALVGATDDAWAWLNRLVSVPPEVAQPLVGIGNWLAQFSDGVLLAIWALGLLIVTGPALLGRQIANLIPNFQREGGLS